MYVNLRIFKTTREIKESEDIYSVKVSRPAKHGYVQ